MECAGCGRTNEAKARYCSGCGLTLQLACPSCGRMAPADAAFCGECGTRLGADAGSRATLHKSPESSRESLPAFFKGGRYVVKAFLGEGARKKVYLVNDTLLDRDVAFALIGTEGLDDVGRQRILREAQTMGRLSDHPNIVPLYDLGDEAGQPYMVLPVLTGGDVEGLIQRAGGDRLPLHQVLAIARDVCRGLAFAHSKGIIHRDLKPGNVWLGSDGTAKIGDFGLAVAADRSRLTLEGALMGTVWYMAPEQAMGGKVDARSDLYALGAMMYEMVTGLPPFVADDSVAIISQHINSPPVAPSWHNPKCPPALEAVVLRLLAKDPATRYASAEEVLSALEAVDAATGAAEPVGEGLHGGAKISTEGVFAGRRKEMEVLKRAVEDTLSGHGRLMMITGDPGVGKTRLVTEVAAYAALRGFQVLRGWCHEESGAPAYWPWVQAVRSYVRDRDAEELRTQMGAGATYISDILPEVRERLPNLAPSSAVEASQGQFLLFDSIANFLRRASSHQPLAIVLDDLHWADQSSLTLLEFVARELQGMRLFIAAVYREDKLAPGHPIHRALASLARRAMEHYLPLTGLSREEVGEFIRAHAGSAAPENLVEAVYARTEGHPLFLTEVVRRMSSEGELAKPHAEGRRSWSIRVPEGVKEIASQRVEGLTEGCRGVLSVAAVLGRDFEVEFLGQMHEDASSDQLLEALKEGVASRIIEEVPDTEGRYQFTHGLLQEALVARLPSARQRQLRKRVAEAQMAELARQFRGPAAAGAQTIVREALAGERALASKSYEEAIARFETALAGRAGDAVDSDTAALLFGLGRAQASTAVVSQVAKAISNLSRAFDYYAAAGETERAIAVADYLPAARGTARVLRRALTLVGRDSYEAGRMLPTYGLALGIEEDDYEGAQDAFQQARSIAEMREDAPLDMRTLAAQGHVDAEHLRWAPTIEHALKAIDLARRVNDPASEVRARCDAATALCAVGDPEAAALHATSAVAASERVPDRTMQVTALWASETVFRLRGRWSQARDSSDRGLGFWPEDIRLLGTRALMEYETGETRSGDDYLARLLESMGPASQVSLMGQAFPALVIPLAALESQDLRHLERARGAAAEVLSSDPLPAQMATMAAIGAGIAAVIRSDAAESRERYDSLSFLRGSMLPVGMSGDRLLGLLAMAADALDDAVALFDDALAFCLRAWYRPEYALTSYNYAEALMRRKGEGDEQRAKAMLKQAADIARQLGMRALTERAQERS